MPQPSRSDVHVNRPLTNISIAYIQRAEDFIADKVFPIVPVMKQSDRYFVYTKESWFRTEARIRAPSSESAGSGFALDNTPSYFADVWAVHKDVDDQTRANSDQPLDMDRDSTMFVTQQLLLRREKQFMSQYMALGVWTGGPGAVDFVPSAVWSDYVNSNPMADIDTIKNNIKKNTGYMPNTLVLAPDVFFILRNHPIVVDRIKYTQRGIVTEDILASLFGVEKLVVALVTNDTAAEGETGVFSYLTSKKFLLVYAAPSPSILQPTGGYIFSWQGLFGAGAQGNRIMSFRMEHLKSDRIEGEMAFAMKLVGADLGCLGKNVIA